MTNKSIILALSIGLLLSGCIQVGFWLCGSAPGAVGVLGALSTLLSAALGFVALRDAKALSDAWHEIKHMTKAAGDKAAAASTKAEAALLGRRLSKELQAKIVSRLSGVTLPPFTVRIGYVPTASQAHELALDIFQFLTSMLRAHCQPVIELRPEGGFPLIESGVCIGVAYASPQPIQQLAEALKSEIPEVEITNGDQRGWANTGGAITTISIVVGHKR